MSNGGTQAVDRAAHLLRRVVQADRPVSFTALVGDSGLSRSTTSRLLAALEANHLVERDASGAYSSGALFAVYAARHDRWSDVARLAQPIMSRVSADTNETVNLGIARGDTVVQIAQIDSGFVLGARDWMHVTVPAHCSALGKVLYAYAALPMPEGPLHRPTPNSLPDADALDREAAEIRRLGYALTREELEIGLDAAAAPVRGADGAVVAALGVSGPSARLGTDLDDIGRLLVRHAEDLSQLLRHRTTTKGLT